MTFFRLTNLMIFFIALVICSTSLWAQKKKNIVPAYIVKSLGDTLHGKAKDQLEVANAFGVRFYHANGDKENFGVKDLLAFGFEDRHYRQFRLPDVLKTTKYLRLVEEGTVALYAHHTVKEDFGPNIDGDFVFQGTKDKVDLYLLKQSEEQLRQLKLVGWKNQMRELLADHAELLQRIETKELRYRNMREIVRLYNAYRKE